MSCWGRQGHRPAPPGMRCVTSGISGRIGGPDAVGGDLARIAGTQSAQRAFDGARPAGRPPVPASCYSGARQKEFLMKKAMLAAVSAMTAISFSLVSVSAEAQYRDRDRDGRQWRSDRNDRA